jgi:hypothetical protein
VSNSNSGSDVGMAAAAIWTSCSCAKYGFDGNPRFYVMLPHPLHT